MLIEQRLKSVTDKTPPRHTRHTSSPLFRAETKTKTKTFDWLRLPLCLETVVHVQQVSEDSSCPLALSCVHTPPRGVLGPIQRVRRPTKRMDCPKSEKRVGPHQVLHSTRLQRYGNIAATEWTFHNRKSSVPPWFRA